MLFCSLLWSNVREKIYRKPAHHMIFALGIFHPSVFSIVFHVFAVALCVR